MRGPAMRTISVSRDSMASGSQVGAQIFVDNAFIGVVNNGGIENFSIPANAQTMYAVMPRGNAWTTEVRSNVVNIPSGPVANFLVKVVLSGLLGLGTPKLDLRVR
jgi:hypothetical protein